MWELHDRFQQPPPDGRGLAAADWPRPRSIDVACPSVDLPGQRDESERLAKHTTPGISRLHDRPGGNQVDFDSSILGLAFRCRVVGHGTILAVSHDAHALGWVAEPPQSTGHRDGAMGGKVPVRRMFLLGVWPDYRRVVRVAHNDHLEFRRGLRL